MKNKDRSSTCCNNHRQQSSKRFCNFCKRFGHYIEICYHCNKSVVSISAATIANTESIQPMAPVYAQSKSLGHTFTISTDDLKNIITNVIRMVGNVSYFSSLLALSGMSHSSWLMDSAYAITWHLTCLYFLNLNLHHTLLIFAKQMVPQCLVII